MGKLRFLWVGLLPTSHMPSVVLWVRPRLLILSAPPAAIHLPQVVRALPRHTGLAGFLHNEAQMLYPEQPAQSSL